MEKFIIWRIVIEQTQCAQPRRVLLGSLDYKNHRYEWSEFIDLSGSVDAAMQRGVAAFRRAVDEREAA